MVGGDASESVPPPLGAGDMLFALVALTAWRRARWCRERAVES